VTTPRLTLFGRCSECGRKQVRLDTDGMGQVLDIPDPCVHFRTAKPLPVPVKWPPTSKKPETKESEMGKRGRVPTAPPAVEREIRDHVRNRLTGDPNLSANELRAEVWHRFDVNYADSTFCRKFATPVRKELGIVSQQHYPRKPATASPATPPVEKEAEILPPHSRSENRPTPPKPVNRIAASNGSEGGATTKLTAPGVDAEFIRLEQIGAGWRLRVDLAFGDAESGRRALAKLLT
jgi:hypothetical protein